MKQTRSSKRAFDFDVVRFSQGVQRKGDEMTQPELTRLIEVRKQAEDGVLVEHSCAAMFACAAIIAELKTALPDAGKEE